MVDPLGFLGDALLGPDDEDGGFDTSLNPLDALSQGLTAATQFGKVGDMQDIGSLFTGRDLYSGSNLSSLESKIGFGAIIGTIVGGGIYAKMLNDMQGSSGVHAYAYTDQMMERYRRLGKSGLDAETAPSPRLSPIDYGNESATAISPTALRNAKGDVIGNTYVPERSWIDAQAAELDAEATVFTSSATTNRLLSMPADEYLAPGHIAGALLDNTSAEAVEQMFGFQLGMEARYSQLQSHAGSMARLRPGEAGVHRNAVVAYEFARWDSSINRKISGRGFMRGKQATAARQSWAKLKRGEILTDKQGTVLADEMFRFAQAVEGIDHPELRLANPLVYLSEWDSDTGRIGIGQVRWDSKALADLSPHEMMDRIVQAMRVHPAQLVEGMSLNLEDMFDQYVTPEAVAAYRNWYQTEGQKIVAVADANNMNARMLTQVAAILSPGENWDTNIQKAADTVKAIREGGNDHLAIQRALLDQHMTVSADDTVKVLLAINHKDANTMWSTGWVDEANKAKALQVADAIGWDKIEQLTDKLPHPTKKIRKGSKKPLLMPGITREQFIENKGFTLAQIGRLYDDGQDMSELIYTRRLSPPNMAQKTIAFDQGLTYSSDLDLQIQRESFENMLFGIVGIDDARYRVPLVADRQSFKTAVGFSMNPGTQLDGVVYDQVAQAHRLAAMRLSQKHGVDMLPEELQATLWSVWRHLSGGDPSDLYPDLNNFSGAVQPGARFPRTSPPPRKMKTAGGVEDITLYGPGEPFIIPAGWVNGKGPQVVTNDRFLKTFSQHSMANNIPIEGSVASLPTELQGKTPSEFQKMREYTGSKPKDPARAHLVDEMTLASNPDGSWSILGGAEGTLDPGVVRGVYPTKYRTEDGRQVFFPRRPNKVNDVKEMFQNLKDSSRFLDDPFNGEAIIGAREYAHTARAAYFAGQPGWYMRIAPLAKLYDGSLHKTAAKRLEAFMTQNGIQFTSHGVESQAHQGISYAFYRPQDVPKGIDGQPSLKVLKEMDDAGKVHWGPPPGVTKAQLRGEGWAAAKFPENRYDYWYEFPTADDQKRVHLLLERFQDTEKERHRQILSAQERVEPIPGDLPEDITYYPKAGRAVAEATDRLQSKYTDRPVTDIDMVAFDKRIDELLEQVRAEGIEIVPVRRKTTPYKSAAEVADDIEINRQIRVPQDDAEFWAVYNYFGFAGHRGVEATYKADHVAFAMMARQLDDNGLAALEQKLSAVDGRRSSSWMRDELIAFSEGVKNDERPRMIEEIFAGEQVTDRQYFGQGMEDGPPGTHPVYEHHYVDKNGRYMTVMSLNGDAASPNTYVTHVANNGSRFEMKNFLDPDRTRLLDPGTGGHRVSQKKGAKSVTWDSMTEIETEVGWTVVAPEDGSADRVFDLQLKTPGKSPKSPDHVWVFFDPATQGSFSPVAPNIVAMTSSTSKPPPVPPGMIPVKIGKEKTLMDPALGQANAWVYPELEEVQRWLGVSDNTFGDLT